MNPNTPVIVGVGQIVERLNAADYEGLTAVELASRAVERAMAQCGNDVASSINAMTVIRTFPDSVPKEIQPLLAPFGWPDNFAGCVADRLGFEDVVVTHSGACGYEPQKWVGIYGQQIAEGIIQAAVICGAEAIATMRKAKADGLSLDWSQSSDYPIIDGGMDTDFMTESELIRHKAQVPTSVYPLLEQARRLQLDMSSDAYAREMGELFAPFSEVAATNPYSMSPKALSVDEIATVSDRNRIVADPHPKAVVARDWVNQGAAIIVMSSSLADELGISSQQRVYLHAHADVLEKPVLERSHLGSSDAMILAYRAAIEIWGKPLDQLKYWDIYSCFPIAVFNVIDHFDLPISGPIPYTVTGGLPFFGGPGNNYSLHAIASIVDKLREDPGAYGIVGANGGFLSKHAVGIYSTAPAEWRPNHSASLQSQIDAAESVRVTASPEGIFGLETYTIIPTGAESSMAIVVGFSEEHGARAVAVSTAPEFIAWIRTAKLGEGLLYETAQPFNLVTKAEDANEQG